MSERIVVGVIGAGTMGSGIAQVAAQAGHPTWLFDSRPGAVEQALNGLRKTMDKLVEKGKLSATDADALHARV
ncbi:MAG TPA: 3-hydroxyacyl-CoA dehydrogenase NAD-binding domain-containing protein, partial [Flavobacteriales bacterium]|nr:3-hydroxyacyl-CoA dehydrogenase NAD-binding domain-containing protein [Flavobacteriales bacterium]